MPPPGDGDQGLILYHQQENYYGVYQVNDVQLDVALPAPLPGYTVGYLYAPTVLPVGNACVEATTVHYRTTLSSQTRHFQGFWNWCNTPPATFFDVFEEIDASFQNKYVRVYNGEPTVAIAIVTVNDRTQYQAPRWWFGHLYNYSVGGWEQKAGWYGTSNEIRFLEIGWTFWESWYLLRSGVACPSIPSIRAMEIQFADPNLNGWRPATDYPSDIQYDLNYPYPCWNGTYQFLFPAPGLPANTWKANTPLP